MDGPFVSFIILSFNRKEPLARAVQSALKQKYERKDVIVVDNGSTDGTPILLEEEFPDIRVVSLSENVGPSAARNRGIEASRGEIVIFLDDDCVLEGENAVDLLVSQFAADPGCGAVGFRILDPKNRGEWPYGLYEGEDSPLIYEAGIFRSGAVAIRRSALDEVGRFWEDLFFVLEDTELALRLVSAGWRIMGRNDIVTWHPAPNPDAPLNPRREIYYKLRNTVWLAAEELPLRLIPRFLLPVFARGFYLSLRTGRMNDFVRAVVASLTGLAACLRRRRPLPISWVRRAKVLRMALW